MSNEVSEHIQKTYQHFRDLLLARKLSGNGKLQMFFGKNHGLTQLQMRLRGEES